MASDWIVFAARDISIIMSKGEEVWELGGSHRTSYGQVTFKWFRENTIVYCTFKFEIA